MSISKFFRDSKFKLNDREGMAHDSIGVYGEKGKAFFPQKKDLSIAKIKFEQLMDSLPSPIS